MTDEYRRGYLDALAAVKAECEYRSRVQAETVVPVIHSELPVDYEHRYTEDEIATYRDGWSMCAENVWDWADAKAAKM